MELRDVKNIVANTIAITCVGLLFLFAFTWIIFNFQGSATSLKDTWSIVSSLFGGIATLAAAYIASILFNDWRVQENEIFKRDLAHAIYNDMGTLLSMLLVKHEKHDINEIQIQFQKINHSLLLYSKKELKIKRLIIDFGVIYTKQIGIYENHKKNNEALKIKDSMDFLNEYSAILHTVAKLVRIDLSDKDTDLYLLLMREALDARNSEWLKKGTDEILDKVRSFK